MPSTFFGLNIAGSGLRAANAAQNTTANNIANAETSGYSKQVVQQQAANALRTYTTYGCAGAGVDTIAIERLRDSFYDEKYRDNETRLGQYNTLNSYMSTLEDYFTDDGKSGFSTIFTSIQTALQEVLKDSATAASKQSFISKSQSLTEYFNNMAGNLSELQKDVNSEIKTQVDSINSIASEIANLDKQINVIEMTGSKANSLRDQRDTLVDKLSKIVDIQTSESPIYDTNNPTRETGANRFLIKIAGGETLVDGNDYNTLTCVARESTEKVNQSDIDGLFNIKWENGSSLGVANSSLGGSIKGLLQMRDGNNGENFKGSVVGAASATATTQASVTVKVTADYLTDLNKSNLSSSGQININSTIYTYTGWTYTKAADGTVTYQFQLKDDITAANIASMTGKDAATGTAVSYEGVPYYMEQMNEWIRNFSEAFNSILQTGYTATGDKGTLMMTGNTIDGTEFTLSTASDLFSGTATTGTVASGDDSYCRLTASNFTIANALIADAGKLATKTAASQTDGTSQYDNITAIVSMLTDKTKMSFRGASAGDFLTSLLGDIALNKNSASTFSSNYTTLENTLGNQRLTVSGVDADEEALNLVDYQNSYTLASKVISTFSEMYDQLILKTGV